MKDNEGVTKHGFAKTTLILFVITLGVKILSLFREILMAAYIGMNQTTDAYNIAILATSLVTGISGIAIGSSLIPVLAGIVADKDRAQKEKFFTNVFWTMMAIAFAVAGILYIFAVPVIRILAPGFDDVTVNFSAHLFQIGFIKINAIVAATLFTQYLNNKNSFYAPMIAASVGTVLIVGYFLFAGRSANVATLMLMTVITYVIQAMWMIPAMIKNGFRFRFYCNPKDTNLILFFSLALPATLNYVAQQVGIVLNRALASQLAIGSVSALAYGNSIVMMINMTVSLSIATVIFPRLAGALSIGNMENALVIFRKGILMAFVLLTPAVVGLIILAEPLSSIMFERGAFTNQNASMVVLAIRGYSIGILAYALYELSNRFFNSMKNTKTPMFIAFIGMAITVTLSYLLYKPLNILGLSLALSMAQVIMAMVLLIIIAKEYGRVFNKATCVSVLQIVAATLVMALVLVGIQNIEIISSWGGVLNLLSKITIAGFIYASSLALLFLSMRKKLGLKKMDK